jgi:hypothetical protein
MSESSVHTRVGRGSSARARERTGLRNSRTVYVDSERPPAGTSVALRESQSVDRENHRSPAPNDRTVAVAEFDGENSIRVDAERDVFVRGIRLTRAGGWLRIGSNDENIPGVLRWIAVHLRVEQRGRACSVAIDRVRFGDVEWDDIERFLAVFDGVWAPHLVEQTRRVFMRALTRV